MRRFAVKLVRTAFALFIAVAVFWGLLYLGFELLLHAAHKSLQSHADPAADYAEAVSRFQRLQKTEGPEINPVCRSILLTHGVRTERAVVFFHGYTNCPQQFRQLGHIFYDMGYNVLVPRLPRHGRADRKVENLSPIKAEELRDCADTSVDIACGLGQKVYVAGLSAGGTLTAWIAQNRTEVTRAVLIAPALGFSRHEGTRLQKGIALLLPLLPDIRTDWFNVDPDAPDHVYPGFSSKALGQLLRVSVATFAGALDRAPRVQDVALVTSKSDEAVSDILAWQLISLWRSKGLRKLATVDFPKEMKIEHDMIDPVQKNQQIEIVYAVLVSLLNAP
ncbi:MAG: alpha/beta fold hydrolase [Verrucomicrobia bacterium]|nr:alpha/beta fold hydrolase [Verrucomicrobiota bacterium]MBV9642756.1 alpha/beta fold hydrolase [Verrucomicrobiota bacterium]